MSVGSLGAGSGIDLESLVKQMVSAQKDAKVKLYQDKIDGYEAELSALGKVGSAIDTFKSSVKALNDDELFTGRDAKIAQTEGEEVIAITTDSTASNGSYAIDVNQLAKGSRVMSAPGTFSSADDVVTKQDSRLTFKAGSNEFSITVDAGTTLSQLRNQINTSEDNFGVSANLVDDGNGNLFFTATSSIQGAANTLKIINTSVVRDEDGNIIDNPIEENSGDAVEDAPIEEQSEPTVDEKDELDLAGDDVDFANDGPIPADEEKDIAESDDDTDPITVDAKGSDIADKKGASTLAANNGVLSLDSVSTEGISAGLYTPLGDEARDAIITVDGIQIRNDTNTFDNAVAGLSIEALAPTDKTTKAEISFDQKTVQETIEEFIASYNDVIGVLQASSDKGAVLNGNSVVRNLQSSLSTQLMSSHGNSGVFTSIFDLGVKMDNKGKLSFDNAKFDNAMKKGYSDIAPLIAGDNGLAQSLENLLDNYTGSSGMTNSLKDSVRRSIDSTEGALESYEDRMVKYEDSLRSKFTSLDSRLANMNAQGGYLNSVLAKM
ncbi:MAG: flagellar filament capping protein FliD [Gammaproteobacteria bacterium]|nr:flagellar filament capping protein FliD [Gammaproteobacteria bacterium]MBU1468738.1 flagellar filament capping protein FliD [Gammaproteobacteria bacterium]MBU2317469.1 flagellar filament capping protein FliD [Gammaproteobacteria bacterium]MBU2412183.1 flagellar filament capping protein FliD [Gammaproteobacteria bacterium]